MKSITCLCEKTIDADLPDEVDLDANPGERATIMEGTFFTVVCPSCGTVLKPELPVRIRSASLCIDVFVLPESERASCYAGAAAVPSACDILIGYDELVERVSLASEGLEPFPIEVLKYFLLRRAMESSPDADISVRYHGMEEGKLVFHIIGMKEGETGIIRVPSETYSEIAADQASYRSKPPYDLIARGPYRSVRVLETAEER
ncbi:MAG: CpXC domain-containing protein [Spirochaetes bacterium]|nr:CpXC domain-containing protein [Spirochaetota bacterium]